ncbi:MAG TPA: type II toxin-antitoxin system VapC family toxin [Polyangiaceae bacterium]|nr:type II toxin-antitoxin system VapC family toxin [Polyangiaceae bacterium]
MSPFLLDTNVFAALSQPAPNGRIVRAFEKHEDVLVTAALVLNEMWFGILCLAPSKKRDHLERFMKDVVGGIPVLPYDAQAAHWHARERARLKPAGRTPSFVDGQIAAVAAVNDATVVTANVADFAFFHGLRVEDWSSGARSRPRK